jgi:hypothetical protein
LYYISRLDHNLKGYNQIQDFASENKNNFSALDETEQVKAEGLLDYLKSDTEPWEKFPQMKKAYKELHDTLKQKLSHLRIEIIKMYEVVFSEINNHKNNLGITESHLTASDAVLERINKEKNFNQLEIYELRINEFRAENFKILEDFKAKAEAKKTGTAYQQSVTIAVANEMPPTTIETPEQLDEYINKLRDRLMIKLAKNQKLFLN